KLSQKKLSEKDGFDCVVVYSRSQSEYIDRGGRFWVVDVRVGTRSNFGNEAEYLVFGKKIIQDKGKKYLTWIPGVWAAT
ncbi:MAG: hypothetical protein COS89_01305, partial [Deltaproteobacteria bacterium CG07_land_8_20_14_0_80_38_7]